jgi:hypothetical protein
MPAKDAFHNAVKNALIKDGWIIVLVFEPENEVIVTWQK